MVGTTRFELATSPTPNAQSTKHQQLSVVLKGVKKRISTLEMLIVPRLFPRLFPDLIPLVSPQNQRGASSKPALSLLKIRCSKSLQIPSRPALFLQAPRLGCGGLEMPGTLEYHMAQSKLPMPERANRRAYAFRSNSLAFCQKKEAKAAQTNIPMAPSRELSECVRTVFSPMHKNMKERNRVISACFLKGSLLSSAGLSLSRPALSHL